ncbi:MAG: Sodium-dependent dicarboxylate transporter SdcS [Myxococcota bacterium]|nr:Sodium-dependent dicarboxylate transporter SdcS [Myxococcota bacterium]
MNGDPPERISSAEEQFERWRRTTGLWFGPLAAVMVLLAPLEMEPRAQRLLACVVFTGIWWLCEAVPLAITALLAPVLLALLGVCSLEEAFAPFANPVLYLFVGGFAIARAMMVHGLNERIALHMLSWSWIGGSPARLLLATGAAATLISMWMSNATVTAMLLPAVLGVLHIIEQTNTGERARDASRFAAAMLLMLAYGASAGGVATPIGTPPNLIGIAQIDKLAGVRITFFQWMGIAAPMVVLMFLLLFAVLRILFPTRNLDLKGVREFALERKKLLGPMGAGERNCLIAFSAAALLWLTPGVLALLRGGDDPLYRWFEKHLPESSAALAAAALLFVLPVNWKERRFTLDWSEASKMDWGVILLFGGGLTLGTQMFKTGLAADLGSGLVSAIHLEGAAGLAAFATALSVTVSELTSNTASANMVIPVVIGMAKEMGVDPVTPALAACFAASFGFMLPISTAPNAIVYGTGRVRITQMLRAGLMFDAGGALIIWFTLMWMRM